MSAEIARLKRQLAERDEQAILQKAATPLREAPEVSMSSSAHQAEFNIKTMCRVLSGCP